jgi:hypothetical protein
MASALAEWLRARGVVEPSTLDPSPDGKLEGELCGRVADRMLPCLLPDGHEGPCDDRFDAVVADAKSRLREVVP